MTIEQNCPKQAVKYIPNHMLRKLNNIAARNGKNSVSLRQACKRDDSRC
jgi:hypothetical protein